MWYLQEVPKLNKPLGPKYWLGGIAGSGRTIGRKHVDIRLTASSVSRKHAEISILKAAFYTPSIRRRSTSVCVKDSSAYGTFLKYPPDHTLNRGEIAGHHRRLDKDTPTDVCEDAQLAFGAPSSWWNVLWYPIVACASRLSPAERTRLQHISGATSLEMSDKWTEDVTHLVSNRCVPTSFKFLTALAFNRQIVTPAWVEAVNLVVTEACKNITDVGTDEAAIVETNLPDEKLFLPPFSSESINFSRDMLATVLDPATRDRRKNLFQGFTFAFAREERRSFWALIIHQLSGFATLAQSVKAQSEPSQQNVIFVREDGKESEVDNEKAWVPESVVIEAILAANSDPLRSALERNALAEATDIATPAPLDADSGMESEESEGSQRGADQGQMENMSTSGVLRSQRPARKLLGTKRFRLQNDTSQKRTRRSPLELSEEDRKGLQSKEQKDHLQGGHSSKDLKDNTQGEGQGGEEDRQAEVDHADINQRAYFTLAASVRAPEDRPVQQTKFDVRPFRRNPPPRGAVIRLKRVPVPLGRNRGDGREAGAGTSARARESRRESSVVGAHLIGSDEE